jgi:tetratricopeptide (TPR) repeat protein
MSDSNIEVVEQKFKEAKKLYAEKKFFTSSDILLDILSTMPDFKKAKKFYKKIENKMRKRGNDLNFAKTSYSKAYLFYFSGEYQQAKNELIKYINLSSNVQEAEFYISKIEIFLNSPNNISKQNNFKTNIQKLFEDGVDKFNDNNFIDCVKVMERIEKLTGEKRSAEYVEIRGNAKEYIAKSVEELKRLNSRDISDNYGDGALSKEKREEADKNYTQGISLYSQGKYYEAQRALELALRLNPDHKKAEIALKKIKNTL